LVGCHVVSMISVRQTNRADLTVKVGRSTGAALVDDDSASSCANAEPAKTAEAQSACATALFNLMMGDDDQATEGDGKARIKDERRKKPQTIFAIKLWRSQIYLDLIVNRRKS
jgi:hypothetical protein